jgi:hypothetical protein
MPQFRIHRMKDQPRETFRWAPHVSAQALVKLKDYEADGAVEALNEYEAWSQMRSCERPLLIGDLLETEAGELRICKYVGFEAAKWFVPEPHAEKAAETPAVSEAR